MGSHPHRRAVLLSASRALPRCLHPAPLVLLAGLMSGGSAVSPVLSAQTQIVMPEAPLLPQHFAAWQTAAAADGQAPRASAFADDTGQAVLKEDGARRTATASYSRGEHGAPLDAEAVQFGDATGAVAAYTYLRVPGMTESAREPGPRNHINIAQGGGRTLVREGTSLVVLAGTPAVADLRALAETLPKVGGPRSLPPLLPTYLPLAGLVPGTVEYALGGATYAARGGVLPASLPGFEKATEAATATYTARGGGRPGKLTLLLLPTPQLAGERGRAIEAWLNSPEAHADGPGTPELGTPKLRRLGPLLILATGGFSPEQASALVDGISLHNEVTWSKPVPPEFHSEVRKTASLLRSIVVLSGVLGLAAVLLGVFLGFGRAWLRVLMGKPAATEPEFLRLDLRGGGDDKERHA